MTKKIVCQDCGISFNFYDTQQKEYKEKGFSQPKRCTACRKRRRENRNPYFGLEEAMMNRVAVHHKRQRVYYPPHIVGGFR